MELLRGTKSSLTSQKEIIPECYWWARKTSEEVTFRLKSEKWVVDHATVLEE
jgi:hypothetical protein